MVVQKAALTVERSAAPMASSLADPRVASTDAMWAALMVASMDAMMAVTTVSSLVEMMAVMTVSSLVETLDSLKVLRTAVQKVPKRVERRVA